MNTKIVYKVTSHLAIVTIDNPEGDIYPVNRVFDALFGDYSYYYTYDYAQALSVLKTFIEEKENVINEAKRRYFQ